MDRSIIVIDTYTLYVKCIRFWFVSETSQADIGDSLENGGGGICKKKLQYTPCILFCCL